MNWKDRRVAQAGTPEWYQARAATVSATKAARLATPKGYENEIYELDNPPEPIEDNRFMAFGRDWENWIVDNLPGEYGIEPNDWLIRAEGRANAWKTATPDGINDDGTWIAEVKTTGKEWPTYSAVPIQYRRQVQWQIYVLGEQVQGCVFSYLLRLETADGRLVPGYYTPETFIVERDDKIIADLLVAAKKYQREVNYRQQANDERTGY